MAVAETVGSTCEVLLEALRDDESAAWGVAVDLYGPLLRRWIRSAGVPEADCVDVLQEALAALVQSLGRFRRERSGDRFRAWLRTIVKRKAADHFRRVGRHPRAAGGTTALLMLHGRAEEVDDSVAGAEPHPRMAAVEAVRAEISPRSWRMFWLAAVEEQPTEEIAAAFGVRPNAVRTNKTRVLQRLREALG